jgi:hypothetical protein
LYSVGKLQNEPIFLVRINVLEPGCIEFIDEKGGGSGVRLRKPPITPGILRSVGLATFEPSIAASLPISASSKMSKKY